MKDLNKFKDFRIIHIERMGNIEADVLSKRVLSFNEIGEVRIEDTSHLNFEE